MAERERYKVRLESFIDPHGAILGDDNQLLVFTPAQAFDWPLIPLAIISLLPAHVTRANLTFSRLMRLPALL
jgi:hypothetical protein